MTFQTQLAATFTALAAVYDAASVTQALSWAQGFVESYCNRPNGFDLVSGDVVTLTPRQGRALLPSIPVASVSEVQVLVQGTWTTTTSYGFDPVIGTIWDTSAWTNGPTWPCYPASLQVTYTHGYGTIPQPLIDAAVRFTQQYLENPTLLIQKSTGAVNERFAGNSGGIGIVINEFDAYILGRYTLTGNA